MEITLTTTQKTLAIIALIITISLSAYGGICHFATAETDQVVILHKVAILGVAATIGYFWPDTRLVLFYGLTAIGIGASLYNLEQMK